MKYVDHIMKYLEGDLNKEEKASFEKELETNAELTSELEQVRLVYEALEKTLKVDSDEDQDRQSFIEDILADHDIHSLGGPPKNAEERQVDSLIKKSMKMSDRKTGSKLPKIFYRSMVITAIAASVAVLILILTPDPTPEKLFANYFKPQEDNILVHFAESSRGEALTGVQFYFAGRYTDALGILGEELNPDDPDPYISLFYVLACLEVECDENMVDMLARDFSGTNKEVKAAIEWYSALCFLNLGESESAKKLVSKLALSENPYTQSAKKLLRKLE